MAEITREQIEKWVAGKGRWTSFSLKECGAYLKDGEIKFFILFLGQGYDENVYNKTYDKIVYFTDYLKSFISDEMTKSQVVDSIENDINAKLN